jgi:hypothetical protein
VRLRAGDTLYLPRGTPHEAVDTTGTSLHATFALLPIRMIDLLEMVVRLAAEDDVELRRAVPLDWLDGEDGGVRFAALATERLGTLLRPERVRLAREVLLNEQFAITRADTVASVAQLEQLAQIAPDTVLRLAAGTPFMVREREHTVDLLIAGRSLGFPPFCKAAFDQLGAGPVPVAAFGPALSEKNRAVLIRTLVLEGLVVLEPAQ